MAGEWDELSLRQAGVQLLDCEHKTPSPAEEGYPYIAIPQIKNGRIDLTDVRLISRDDYVAWTRKTNPQCWDVILSRRCNPGETAFVPPGLECALRQNLGPHLTDPGQNAATSWLQRWSNCNSTGVLVHDVSDG